MASPGPSPVLPLLFFHPLSLPLPSINALVFLSFPIDLSIEQLQAGWKELKTGRTEEKGNEERRERGREKELKERRDEKLDGGSVRSVHFKAPNLEQNKITGQNN